MTDRFSRLWQVVRNRAEDSMASWLGEHAVVIGGSIAGLMSARVLADYFDQATILERDHI